MNRITIFSLLFISLTACQTEQNANVVDLERLSFFDLETYIETEAERLNTQIGKLKKEMTVDGVTEQQVLTEVDFGEELALFADLNINRPIWLDKYRVDSIFGEPKRLEAIEYTAIDEKLKTNKLIIDYDASGEVQGIMIHNNSSSIIMESKQLLSYTPNSGYQIETYQDPLFFEDKEIVLNGSWGE